MIAQSHTTLTMLICLEIYKPSKFSANATKRDNLFDGETSFYFRLGLEIDGILLHVKWMWPGWMMQTILGKDVMLIRRC